jgi:hypothetical protein
MHICKEGPILKRYWGDSVGILCVCEIEDRWSLEMVRDGFAMSGFEAR